MSCFKPLTAYAPVYPGAPLTFSRPVGHSGRTIALACGQCIGCKLSDAALWGIRVMGESRLHPFSAFVTLTQSPEFCDPSSSLSKRDLQLFHKRARKAGLFRRFLAIGEYGTTTARAHYHGCYFGADCSDWKHWRTNERGDKLYRSARWESAWGRGNVELGFLDYGGARYVCGHGLRAKHESGLASGRYVDPGTGEIVERARPFRVMSNRPGIGAGFVERFASDVSQGYMVCDGRKWPLPPYYLDVLARSDPARVEVLRAEREAAALTATAKHERKPARLGAREVCTVARLKVGRRGSKAGCV